MALIDECPGIIAEIGPNNYFEINGNNLTINYSRAPGTSNAQLTIQIPADQPFPRPPQLAAIIPANRNGTLFSGYMAKASFSSNDLGTMASYSITIEDLFTLTRRKVIIGYSRNMTLNNHLGTLIELAGVNQVLSFSVFTGIMTDFGALDFDPNSTMFNFTFDQGYLNEALDALAGATGLVWEIAAASFRPSNVVDSMAGVLGTVIFRSVDFSFGIAPRDTIRAPGGVNLECDDVGFYQSLSYEDTAPGANTVTVVGANGLRFPFEVVQTLPGGANIEIASYTTSIRETNRTEIPVNSTQLNYNYPPGATAIGAVKLISN
jgi:hypothetical protein